MHNLIALNRSVGGRIVILMMLLWLPQRGDGQTPKIDNVRFTVQDSAVLILYDLSITDKKKSGNTEYSLDGEYRTELLLKKESDPEFMYRPEKLSGDIGVVTTTGKDKTITWNILDELPGGVDDSEFYFEIALVPSDPAVSSQYLWYGAGAALVATGIVTYFITSETQGNESTPGKFPLPPGRPK